MTTMISAENQQNYFTSFSDEFHIDRGSDSTNWVHSYCRYLKNSKKSLKKKVKWQNFDHALKFLGLFYKNIKSSINEILSLWSIYL